MDLDNWILGNIGGRRGEGCVSLLHLASFIIGLKGLREAQYSYNIYLVIHNESNVTGQICRKQESGLYHFSVSGLIVLRGAP